MASLLLFPSGAAGLNATVTSTAATYKLGSTVVLHGSVVFDINELKNLTGVSLTIAGAQPCSAALPLTEGTNQSRTCTPSASGTLSVDVDYNGVTAGDGGLLGAGYGYGGYGYGTTEAHNPSIDYTIRWPAPVFLSPAPVFTLLPQTDAVFNIPQITPPTAEAGLPDPLPTVTEKFAIPQLTTPDPNAPAALPTLTALTNAIPLATTPDPNAPADLPTLTLVGTGIPDASPAPVANVATLPDVTLAFAIPGNKVPQGIATDGTNFYILVNGSPHDEILKVDDSGNLVTAFGGGDGIADVMDSDTNTHYDQALSIAFLNNILWVSHDDFEDSDILKFSSSTGALTGRIASPSGERYQGLDPDGTDLWGFRTDGCNLRRFDQNGESVDNSFLSCGTATSLAVDGNFLYAGEGSSIQRRSKDTGNALGTAINPNTVGTIRGMAFGTGSNSRVLYMADLGTNSIYKAQFASTFTTSPRGIAYDGSNLWLLVDASVGNDKILKLDTSGALVTAFGTGGAVDAPSPDSEGITFVGNKLWVLFNDVNGNTPRFQEINRTTGALVGSSTSVGSFPPGFGDLANDGTDLVGVDKSQTQVRFFDTSGAQTDSENLPFSGEIQGGANGLAFRSSKNQFFAAKTAKIVGYNRSFSELGSSFVFSSLAAGVTPLNIHGLVFVGDVLYIADDATDKIYKASLPTGETTNPQGITSDGTNLWVLTDAAGNDKLLKLNKSTGALIASYDAPSASTEGITYLGGFLWVLYSQDNQPKFQKMNTSGQNVGSPVSPSCCHPEFGGLTNNGTDLVVVSKTSGEIRLFSTAGDQEGSGNFSGGEINSGANGLAFRSAGNQYFAAKGAKIVGHSSTYNQVSRLVFTGLTVDSTTLNTKGMTFDGDVLYVADDATDKIYKASVPAVLPHPRGLAADSTSLYILVDNEPNDSIVKVDRTTGQKVTAFGTSGVAGAGSPDTHSITLLANKLWVGFTETSQFGQDTSRVAAFSPSTGASVTGGFTLQCCPGDITGMGSDGSVLYLGFSGGGNVRQFETDGDELGFGRFFNDLNSGVTALDVRVNSGVTEMFAVRNNRLRQFDFDAQSQMTDWTLAITKVQGLAVLGNVAYFAEDTTDKIYAASIPQAAVTITKTPKAMTDDDASLYIVVEGSPKDQIMKVTTGGAFVTSFGTGGAAAGPSNNITAIDFFDNALWVAGSDVQTNCFNCQEQTKFYKLNKDTGTVESSFDIPQTLCCERVTGLSNNGSDLIGGFGGSGGGFFGGGSGQFFKLDPDNPNGAQRINQNEGTVPRLNEFDSVLFAVSKLWGVDGSTLNSYTLSGTEANGAVSFTVGNVSDVTGLAYIHTTVYLADAATQAVRGSTFQENRPERTTAGSYTAQIAATFNPTVTSALRSFSLVKANAVDAEITSPADNVTVTTSPVTVTGTVDDPSITEVILGAELASTILFQDGAENGDTSEDKFDIENSSGQVGWHVDCDDKAFQGSCSWHYAKEMQGAGHYDTSGQSNSGNLVIDDLRVGEGTKFRFYTWYNTEGDVGTDKKVVEVNVEGDDSDVGWKALRQIIAPFVPQNVSNPSNAHSGFQYVRIRPANATFTPPQFGTGDCPPNCFPQFQPVWTLVEIDMAPFVGQVVDVRFRFDTVNSFFNFFEGWNIDNIEAEGKGSSGAATAPVSNGEFTTSFALVDGANQVSITAVNPYTEPFGSLKDIDTITVNLDTTNPIVSITQNTVADPTVADVITSESSVTVSGSFVEFNFASLLMSNETVVGNIPVLVVTGSAPANNEFSASVDLAEGDNLVTVTVTDGANRAGSAAVRIYRDTVGPTLTSLPTVYPVGVVSARPRDPIIFQLNASDAATSVRCVEVLFTASASSQATCQAGGVEDTQGNPIVAPFLRPEEIPQAVRDTWGTTGQWLFPARVPSTALPGTFNLSVRLVDQAGNTTSTTVQAVIVASLSSVNIGLMPGENLISLPLIPDDRAAGNLARLLAANPRMNVITDAIWYYDATLTSLPVEDRWVVYTPATGNTDTLTDLKTGRGYWWITLTNQFVYSAPLPGLSQQTPKVENFAYAGVFLRKGAEAPPVYVIEDGWNLIGFHSEKNVKARDYLAALSRGDAAKWSSLLRFDNFIDFPIGEEGDPRFELGHFTRVFETEEMEPTQGFWLFSTADGFYTP